MMMKRVSQRVRVMTPRLKKVESMSQIRIVRSLVERRLPLHTGEEAGNTNGKRTATGGTENLRAP